MKASQKHLGKKITKIEVKLTKVEVKFTKLEVKFANEAETPDWALDKKLAKLFAISEKLERKLAKLPEAEECAKFLDKQLRLGARFEKLAAKFLKLALDSGQQAAELPGGKGFAFQVKAPGKAQGDSAANATETAPSDPEKRRRLIFGTHSEFAIADQFAERNGWRHCYGRSGQINGDVGPLIQSAGAGQLTRSRPAADDPFLCTSLIDPRELFQDVFLFQHVLYFNAGRHQVCIVTQPCGDMRDRAQEFAESYRLQLHVPPRIRASFHFPTTCLFLAFTLPGVTVNWLPGQLGPREVGNGTS